MKFPLKQEIPYETKQAADDEYSITSCPYGLEFHPGLACKVGSTECELCNFFLDNDTIHHKITCVHPINDE